MLRFAPSPTGDMHIGDLRVAILNYLVAKQRDESFIVRIEDRDKARNIEGKDTEIMQILEKFALLHDSVSHQSQNLHMHQTLAIRLLQEDKAFVCICKDESELYGTEHRYSGRCQDMDEAQYTKLKESKTPFVVRIKKPTEDITTHDMIKGDIKTAPNEVDSFVILREDSTPTYNFACACDDMLSGVDFIIRGDEHLCDTPRQKHIQNLLGYESDTTYVHLPPIVDGDKISIQWMLEEGFVPDAIINYILLFGNSKAPKEIFTLPEAIEWFDISTLSKSPAKFDIDKLRFINREHLKLIDDKLLSTLFGFADASIGRLAKIYLEEVSTTKELEAKITPIFAPKNFDGEWSEQMRLMEDIIQNAPNINEFNEFISYMIKQSGLKGENLFNPLRLLLTGLPNGPELSEIYPFIKSYLLEVAS